MSSTAPRKKPSKGKPRPRRAKAEPKIRKDPIAEYRERVAKDGVVDILTLADDDCAAAVRGYVSTRSLALDWLLNNQGMALGRIFELYGPSHLGKSTILDHIFAEVQAQGGIAILGDIEASRDIRYTGNIGVDPAKLLYAGFTPKTTTMEDVVDWIIRTTQFWRENYPEKKVVIGWDSLGGTAPKDEWDKELGEAHQPAMAARLMRIFCRQIPALLSNSNIALVVINHEYVNIKAKGPFGPSKQTYAGEALRLAATYRIGLYHKGLVKDAQGAVVGRQVGARIVKNRLGPHDKEASLCIVPGHGISNVWTLYNDLTSRGVIVRSGSWSSINLDGEIIKFQGWQGLAAKCEEDETLFPRLVSVYLAEG